MSNYQHMLPTTIYHPNISPLSSSVGSGIVYPQLYVTQQLPTVTDSSSFENIITSTAATVTTTGNSTTSTIPTSTLFQETTNPQPPPPPISNSSFNLPIQPTTPTLPLIPTTTPIGLTVQDNPFHQPIYNGVNPNYPNLKVLHQNPPIFTVDNFLTSAECDFLITIAQDCFSPAPVVGSGAGEVSPSRTSSTCYLAREDLPEYLRKVSYLTGKPVEHFELPQVGRYFPTQQYKQHFDAFDLSDENGRRFAANGGQRTVTVLVYLNDVLRGGETSFPTLNIDVQPKKGTALVFFPSTIDGLLDQNTLHAAKPAIDTKYVSQVWIRQGYYDGIPSKRIFTSVEQASLVQKGLLVASRE
jgi:prolyl 4-hydroxylase